MAKIVKREQFPYKQYQIPSQYYKMLVVKIVWTGAATYWKTHYSHLPYKYFQASILNKNANASQGAV